MKINVRSYAVLNGTTKVFHNFDREAERLDKLEELIKDQYGKICERCDIAFNAEHKRQAKFHAAALWLCCEKMQVINRVKNTRYVLEVTVLSGEHDAAEA